MCLAALRLGLCAESQPKMTFYLTSVVVMKTHPHGLRTYFCSHGLFTSSCTTEAHNQRFQGTLKTTMSYEIYR